MKTTLKKWAILGLLAASSSLNASENPTGNISADSELVLAGTFPKIDWNINYPVSLDSIVDLSPLGEITPKENLLMQVRCLAADVQERRQFWNGWRWVVTFRYITVTGYGSRRPNDWRLLFNDIQPNVDPTEIVWEDRVKVGDDIKFAARADFSGGLWYYSGEGSPNVLVMRRGEVPPSYATWDTQSTLGTHIAPYLDVNGTIDIGPRDLIVAFELTHVLTGSADDEGDVQDMIFLLTFQVEED